MWLKPIWYNSPRHWFFEDQSFMSSHQAVWGHCLGPLALWPSCHTVSGSLQHFCGVDSAFLFPAGNSHSALPSHPAGRGCVIQQDSSGQGCSNVAPTTSRHGAWGSLRKAKAWVPPRSTDADSGGGAQWSMVYQASQVMHAPVS